MASFTNKRCANGGVHPTDSLLFTCELNGVPLLRVVLPSGSHEHISLGGTANTVKLPRGFTAVSLNVTEVAYHVRNFTLSISIASASLLDGGEIRCDDTTLRPNTMATARCPLGKLWSSLQSVCSYILLY